MTREPGRGTLHVPALHFFREDGLAYAVDAEAPNWIAVDPDGAEILEILGSAEKAGAPLTQDSLTANYAALRHLPATRAWMHVHDFLGELRRAQMLSSSPVRHAAYPGRSALIYPEGLHELWIQINNACNLTCTHCLVSSGPGGEPGLDPAALRGIVDRAGQLGLERLYVTGGEPFLRKDIFDLAAHVTETLGAEMVVLTNGTVFAGAIRKGLDRLSRERVKFQVSIDGARPETNDRIRGAGTFAAALDGARLLADLGFEVSLTTVTTEENLSELREIPAIIRRVGASSQHLMWSHKRGRAAENDNGFFPETQPLLEAVCRVIEAAEKEGTTLDNLESVKRRVNGVPGIKYDLGNAGWDSVCVYADGTVYPTAALAGEAKLSCGDVRRQDLAEILETSPVIRSLREATLARKPDVAPDPYRFLTGGGDVEHAWCFSGDFLGVDPYYPIAQALVRRVMTDLGREKRARASRSGLEGPRVYHAMGAGSVACGTADGALAERPVLTLHSNCVLSFDADRPRAKVREYYGEAAETPKPELCCPLSYPEELLSHVPREVIDRFYGCGSPMGLAQVQPGETVVDLGSGAGIDVFIAARLVGPAGKAIGVDMTDRMLQVAHDNQPRVAAALGYDAVDFREGFLEKVPVDSGSVDLVTSNCVINLSPDKPAVFEEIWRILKADGRAVLSDIVSESRVPPHLKTNPQLWGECIVGALTQEEFLASLERTGFHGLQILTKSFWRNVEGIPFYSVTVRGYKKAAGSAEQKGHRAMYLGPGKAFVDDDGTLYPRNEARDVSEDIADRLSKPPYRGSFAILLPGEDSATACCAPPSTAGCC
jgi:MoaA/NifB/PqqE/SkfB family radical SAM enzyme/SAM-dependent methyltransferase